MYVKRFTVVIVLSLLCALAWGQLPGGMMIRGRGPGDPGNQDRGFISGRVWFLPEEGSDKEVPGAGTVVVVVTSRKDTLFTTVAESGRFRLFNLPLGTAQVRFNMIGYAEEGHPMDITPGENKVVAYLRPEAYQLEAAVKKETVPPVAVDKDTIIFRAAAVKVNKGEMAIDILAQMPGVEVTETSATVLNEEVKRVYVDGALLFGEAPMSALNNLPAEEVVDIRSYQEYANKDPHHKISENEEKERVLDVRTKNKPKAVFNGDLLAGGGFDTDSTYHKFRYATGVSLNSHSETLQAFFRANLNNINDGSIARRGNSFRTAGGGGGGGSPDLRSLSVSASVNRRWMSPNVRNLVLFSLGGSYSYSDNYNVSESLTEKIYFPNEKYTSRSEEQGARSVTTGKAHNFSLSAHKYLKDGGINLSGNFRLKNDGSLSQSSHYNQQDDLPRQGTSTRTDALTRGTSYGLDFGIHKRFADKLGLRLNLSGSGSDSDGSSLKTDSTTTTISHKEIDISTLGASRNWSVTPSLSWEIDSRRTLSASAGWSDSFSRTERLAYDISDPQLSLMDTVNTYTHTTDHNTRSVNLGYRSYFKGIGAVLNAGLRYTSTGINKHETFPEEDLYDHRFRFLAPSVSLSTQSMINNWRVSYSSSNATPSVEQIRPRINNTNLYNVSAGNPDLKQSRTHSANLSFSTVLGAGRETVRQMETGQSLEGLLAAQGEGIPGQAGNDGARGGNDGTRGGMDGMRGGMRRGPEGFGMAPGRMGGFGALQELRSLCTFSTFASFSMTQNPIVGRRTYYARDTYLPDYDYTMPAQSTFSTWENAPDSYSASASARLDVPLLKIRWLFNVAASLNWDSTPSYINETLTRTRNWRPTVRLGMRSNFSRNVRINLNGTASYVHSDNDQQDATRYFTERISVGWEVNNILKHLYVGGNYNKSFTQGLPYDRVDDNIFDARAGARFGPRNNIELSASVHDLFNTTSGFSTSMTADYINNRRVHQFGRYVMFSLSWRFNRFGRQ